MTKLRTLLFLTVAALLFQSCSKNGKFVFLNKANVVGVWTTSKTEVFFTADGRDYHNETLVAYFESGNQKVKFREDNTYIKNEATADEERGTWYLEPKRDVIILVPNLGESYGYEILSSNSNQLKVRIERDFTAFANILDIEINEEFIVAVEAYMTEIIQY